MDYINNYNELKKKLEAVAEQPIKTDTLTNWNHNSGYNSQCPSCGYCPHCGRMNPTRPAYPSYPMPMFVDKTDNYDMRQDPNKVYC